MMKKNKKKNRKIRYLLHWTTGGVQDDCASTSKEDRSACPLFQFVS